MSLYNSFLWSKHGVISMSVKFPDFWVSRLQWLLNSGGAKSFFWRCSKSLDQGHNSDTSSTTPLIGASFCDELKYWIVRSRPCEKNKTVNKVQSHNNFRNKWNCDVLSNASPDTQCQMPWSNPSGISRCWHSCKISSVSPYAQICGNKSLVW